MRIAALSALALLIAAACGGAKRPVVHASRTVDPYKAALAFARCMRQHGVPHPNPDSAGNFHLTPHQEQLEKVLKDPRFLRERTACEQKLNAKLDAIIAADRHEPQY